ncbi:restriction endonuclease subunit S [Pontibacter sp. HSC-36F09]|uniref:restriction endonuclease subunit S n=1 Tax=Pontibacter sp. HSC-36F09 TaxID=2910966 RepID=UPI00209D0155|nr:restriction endonuclease subunit S [Pontibacter sp. HSC-36F09]MCP2044708.1 type I restriction enzyme S subunit [Pontibacter sp. HSC-36F09]
MLLLEQFENLTLHPKNAARLKELVLQLAVQGKLTENWRRQNPEVEPAAVLLKRIEAEKAQLVKEKKIKKEKPLDPISEDEIPYTLPEGWVWCRMGDIGYTNIGLTYSPKDISDKGIPVLRSSNVQNGKICLNDLVRVDRAVDEKAIVKNGDLLICARNGSKKLVGKCAIINDLKEEMAFGAFMAIFRCEYNSYIKYFIESPTYRESLEGVSTTTINQITQGNLKNTLLPLPPLAEQEAIVAQVEELMQKIEELEKQTAERIQLKQHLGAAALQQLTAATDEELEQNWLFLKQHFQTMFDEAANVKKLRETILQLAVQGRLTATWRTQNPTTEPASDLLKRIQAEKSQLVKEKKIKKEKPLEPISEDEVPYTLPEGWVWCRLGFATNFIDYRGKTPLKIESGIKLITAKNVKKGFFSPTPEEFISEESYKSHMTRGIPNKGDILFTTEAPMGSACLLEVDPPFALAQRIITIQPIVINSKYLLHTFLSAPFQGQLQEKSSGMTATGIKSARLITLPIPIPPLAEQEAIVAKVDQLMQLCDELEHQIQQSKQETEALMQAVVQVALQVNEEVFS